MSITYHELAVRGPSARALLPELAAMLAAYAATGETMIATVPCPVTSPLYDEVTMGLRPLSLAQGWYFSSCAYLCHWVLECLGLAEKDAKGKVLIGRTGKADNPLSRLAYHHLSEPIGADTVFASGDIVQIGQDNSAHIYVALADNEAQDAIGAESTAVLGAHYGAEGLSGDTDLNPITPPELIGGAVRLLNIKRAFHGQMHGNRRAFRVLRLASLALPHEAFALHIPSRLWDWPGFADLRSRAEAAT